MSKLRTNILIPFTLCLILFGLSTGLGVWAAPDKTAAWNQFWVLMAGLSLLGLTALTGSNRKNSKLALLVISSLISIIAAGFALYFLVTVNWPLEGSSAPIISDIGYAIHTLTPALSELQSPDKNLTGGILIILISMGAITLVGAQKRREWPFLIMNGTAILIALFGLAMTTSRGAVSGLIIGALFATYFYWRVRQSHSTIRLKWLDITVLLLATLCISWSWLALSFTNLEGFVASFERADSFNRYTLWQYSLPLLQDYPFTGSGLGNTTMVYSSYVFLLHVPFLPQSQNLTMQIAIEQGFIGMVGFMGMIITAVWATFQGCYERSDETQMYGAFIVMSLVGYLVHGTVDAAVYRSYMAFLLFIPLGLAVALWLSHPNPITPNEHRQIATLPRVNALSFTILPLLIVALMFVWPGSQAKLQANLGAVKQTRAELSVYSWPDWPIQDALRRPGGVDLTQALAHYHRALELDPYNVTALRRLGQYELALANYDDALIYMQAAHTAAPAQRPTRQILGELYALNEQPEKAVALWETIHTGNGQLAARSWWYHNRGLKENAIRFDQAVSLLNEN